MSQEGHGPWAAREPSASDRLAFAEASSTPFWLDSSQRPDPRPALEGSGAADLAIVGGGLSGLWAGVLAKEREPGREVVVLEAGGLAGAASGRNGGFLSSFLTHGIANGMARFPEEMSVLERLGLANFAATREAIARLGIDCAFEATGDLDVAVEAHEVPGLAEEAAVMSRLGHEVELLDREQVRAQVHSPIYEGGLWRKSGAAIVDPARLCWGLARAAERLGVRIHERTQVKRLRPGGSGVRLATATGAIDARGALLATSAFPGLLGEVRRRVVPVWDYALVTEPLSASQRDSIGWRNRQGIGDVANRFHYYRLTADDRILWGGYDAIYRYASAISDRLQQDDGAFAALAGHFLPFHSSKGSASATAGAARSTPAAASSPSRGRRSAAGSRTRSATPGSGSAPAASAPRSPSTCSPAARPRRPGCARFARSRLRSRPSRCAGRRSSSPATVSPRPTGEPAGAGSGCGRSTGSGSASIAEGGRSGLGVTHRPRRVQ